ncbi:MAG: hypothetical protein H0U65_14690 [Rubrobacter sp.]|nr:hypothetical protein [Rubrobacter sp.]
MTEKARKVRIFRIAALVVVLVGVPLAFLTGTWREGVLGFFLGAGFLLFGIGELVRGEDRGVAIALTVIGSVWTAGHVVQILLFW